MKIVKPQFYGMLGDNSILHTEHFIVKSIDSLELVVSELPSADILSLSGVCCLVTESGKSCINKCGLDEHFFHKVNIKGMDIEPLYYIDPRAKGKEIEVYRSASLLVEDKELSNFKYIKTGGLQILEYLEGLNK